MYGNHIMANETELLKVINFFFFCESNEQETVFSGSRDSLQYLYFDPYNFITPDQNILTGLMYTYTLLVCLFVRNQ